MRGWIGALLLLLAGANAVAAQRRLDERRAFAPDGSIRILNAVGTVRVIGWNRDSIAVTGTVWEDQNQFMIGNDPRAMKLGMWDYGSAQSINPSHIEVRVPARASVWVKTASADIEALGLAGSVDLNSVSGRIRVVSGPRDINIETMGGDVDAYVAAPVMRIRTAAGNVTVRGASQDVIVHTVSGAMNITGGPLEHGLFESVTGAITFGAMFEAGSTLEFQTHSGIVQLDLPQHPDADVTLSTFTGKVRNALNARRVTPRADLRGQELSFTDGVGGSSISVRTFSGDMVIAQRK
jgi:hypothetical protein